MLAFFDFFVRPIPIDELPLEHYTFGFSLKQLTIGVDNIHYDVHLSPDFRRATGSVAGYFMARQSGAETFLDSVKPAAVKESLEAFQKIGREVLTEAVHKAKYAREIQIDYLAQVAVAKLFLQETEIQHQKLVDALEQQLRSCELSLQQDLETTVSLREKLTWIRQNRKTLLRHVRKDLFKILSDLNKKEVSTLREANFGAHCLLPESFFSNPLLHQDPPVEGDFLLENYILLSHRFEDPDNCERLIALLNPILEKSDRTLGKDTPSLPPEEAGGTEIPSWLMVVENVDVLFNPKETTHRIKQLAAQKGNREELRHLRALRKTQAGLLRIAYRHFRKARLMGRITAGFDIPPLLDQYCPPLVPQQILQYVVEPASRRRISAQLNRLKGFYRKSFSMAPLQKLIRQTRRLSRAEKMDRLLRFIRALVRYHRDRTHFRILKEAMDSVNLDLDERTLQLSSENRTLYDFLRSGEKGREKREVKNHVILKADVRGSTDLTYRMRAQGLNPASFFSLNLFDPITEILFEYDASKEFIEGDALILSILEHEDTPEGWYAVARACGIAVRMLQIVDSTNIKSRKHGLPILELGIGICYQEGVPAFLFDGSSRIMISSAINRADRLSGCDKDLRRLIEMKRLPFHVYVFQSVSDEKLSATADDLLFRYNVNGIELNPEGFRKLSQEINLLELTPTGSPPQATHRFLTGKVPLTSGRMQPLVIREAPIYLVEPNSLKIIRKTDKKYYEVCTHPKLYESAALNA